MSGKRSISSKNSALAIEDDEEELGECLASAGVHGSSVGSTRRRSSSGSGRRRSSFGANKSPEEQARLAEMYKTIIKLSSENKITSKNSWKLDLIDHMGNLIKSERDDGGRRKVNFQKASCTLDASIKIYSHRVDDTHSISFRVLENLSRNGNGDYDAEEDDEESGDEQGEGKDRTGAKVGSKKASSRLGISSTIEKNPANLNATDLDNNSAVDPLFHKVMNTTRNSSLALHHQPLHTSYSSVPHWSHLLTPSHPTC
jgi:hypothetical protein